MRVVSSPGVRSAITGIFGPGLLQLRLPGLRAYPPGLRWLNCTDALKERCDCRYHSQRHAESVDETPFAAFQAVHDGDSANDAAGRPDPFPVRTHFSSPQSHRLDSPVARAFCRRAPSVRSGSTPPGR